MGALDAASARQAIEKPVVEEGGTITQVLKRTQKSLGPARASIIAKGMIYSTDHGYLDFTVPLFAEFMRRQG